MLNRINRRVNAIIPAALILSTSQIYNDNVDSREKNSTQAKDARMQQMLEATFYQICSYKNYELI